VIVAKSSMGRGSPVVFRVTSILTEFEQAKGRVFRNSSGVAGRPGITPSQNTRIKILPREIGGLINEVYIRVAPGGRILRKKVAPTEHFSGPFRLEANAKGIQ
jgi:hypothetical protein